MSTVPANPSREHAFSVVRTLRSAGFEAYWAGGCVRDQLMGKPPKDYDVATSAKPEEIRALFGRRQTVAVGAAFGVISVLGPKPAAPIEVATFREDLGYSDGRHPDAVRFSTPQADAQRRDFTINGLFYDPVADEVLDFVDGRQDLQAGVIRAIGNPAARIAEDKLRMLRAVRFAAVLGFELDPATAAAIRALAEQINVVSPERIAAELRRMLEHASRRRGIELLEDVGLLGVVLPEFKEWNAHQRSVTLHLLDAFGEASFPLALAALLWRNASTEQVERLGERLKLSNRDRARLEWLFGHADALVDAARQPWPRVQRVLIADGAGDLIQLTQALCRLDEADERDVAFCQAKLALPSSQLNPPALINGNDLTRRGIAPGPVYQTLLEAVRDAQLEGLVTSRDQALELAEQIAGGSSQ